jgi:hypothetical protein
MQECRWEMGAACAAGVLLRTVYRCGRSNGCALAWDPQPAVMAPPMIDGSGSTTILFNMVNYACFEQHSPLGLFL